ncbi:MAG TPA: redoxin domain-containing protein [Leptospiraceae bacterium]|nr:redoxin domain-containing protein [Leptospiraceae bacterium]HMW05460.1 redoxin domain-containing protein [Leptospiraceae bacterium]HMX31391.1 redoxin domain-containing protein [Leptospiraceae bacterium]HMY30970.1 redoxin domain-containing protein [Leptospiraceae bacterium]HMZ64416.1 redoxin domain-containing protein [Leptospiraceae bacterium]
MIFQNFKMYRIIAIIRSFIFLLVLLTLSLGAESVEEVKPWLGVAIETAPNGVRVREAIVGTPAEKAGLKKGDVITKIDSIQMKESEQMIKYIRSKGVGNEVKVEFERDTKKKKLAIVLEAKPDEFDVVKKQLLGKEVVDFKLTSLDGKKSYTKKDLENKITIFEFWATWCMPCRASHTRLSEFAEQNPSIQVLAISTESKDLIQNYLKEKNHKFTTVQDEKGDVSKFFMVSAIPTTALIDKNGKIKFLSLGGGIYLEETLKNALSLSKEK